MPTGVSTRFSIENARHHFHSRRHDMPPGRNRQGNVCLQDILMYFFFTQNALHSVYSRYIIADGLLQVLTDDGRVITTMKSGDFFGEIGVLNLDHGANR